MYWEDLRIQMSNSRISFRSKSSVIRLEYIISGTFPDSSGQEVHSIGRRNLIKFLLSDKTNSSKK